MKKEQSSASRCRYFIVDVTECTISAFATVLPVHDTRLVRRPSTNETLPELMAASTGIPSLETRKLNIDWDGAQLGINIP